MRGERDAPGHGRRDEREPARGALRSFLVSDSHAGLRIGWRRRRRRLPRRTSRPDAWRWRVPGVRGRCGMFACSLLRQPPRHATSDSRSRARGTAPEPTRNRPLVPTGGALPRSAESGSPLGWLLGGWGHERPSLEFRNDGGGVDDPSEAQGYGEIDLATVNGFRGGGDGHLGTAGELGQGEAAESNRVGELGVEGVPQGHAPNRGEASLIASRVHAVVAVST